MCSFVRYEYFQKRLLFTVPRHVLGGGGGRVLKFTFAFVDPHNEV